LSVILSKDPRRKLTRGSRALYAQKIEEAETAEGETVKNREQFQIRQRFTKKSCRRQEHLKNSKNSFKFVKDSCRRQNRLKNFGNSLKSVKDCSREQLSFKELVKFFQIFERFTNFSSAGENPCKYSKDHVKEPRTAVAAVRSILRKDLRRKSSSEGTRRAQKRRKNFSR
jgi:hypothetical protein